jgi:hypothetical protein
VLARSDIEKTIDYRFDEPWDSDHNRTCVLTSTLPSYYTCPLESNLAEYPFATYVMLVRPVLPSAEGNVAPGSPLPEDAVIVVESANCAIECGEPRDLDWNILWQGDSPFGLGKLNSFHTGIVKAIRLDGKVIDIPKDISNAELRQLLNGGTKSTNLDGGVRHP